VRSTIIEIAGVPHRPCPGCRRLLPQDAWFHEPARKGGFGGRCKECRGRQREADAEYQRAHQVAYRVANRERLLAQKAAARRTHPEKHKAQAKASYERHREKRLAERRAYNRGNRERLGAQRKAFYAANPRRREEVRAYQAAYGYRWRKANAELTSEYARRRRARVRELTLVEPTMELLSAKWDYWAGRCWMCSGEAVEWDHVKPLSKGGAHCLANLRPACVPCNRRKSATWPFQTV
jgi:5-methylcytosine-specific restriction endonuclease McrA